MCFFLGWILFLWISPPHGLGAERENPGPPSSEGSNGSNSLALAPSSVADSAAKTGAGLLLQTGPFIYDLQFQLEVEGSFALVSRTRYYRSEDIHMKLAANPSSDGWHFHSLDLVTSDKDINFGIGEGPARHQRYILLSHRPADDQKLRIQERVLELEKIRGCSVRGNDPKKGAAKKAFFNYYLWDNPRGSFQFVVTPLGKIRHVANHVNIEVLSRKGGKRANPRFFDTLKYSMLALPPISGSFLYAIASKEPVQWEMECTQIQQGLTELVRNVYGRKMTLLEPRSLEDQKVIYEGDFVPGTSILRVKAAVGPLKPTTIRVSGLKGELSIESFKREVYLDMSSRRILKDDVEISFGIARNKRIFPVTGRKNIVRFSLVDECFLGCADTHRAILMADGDCTRHDPEM